MKVKNYNIIVITSILFAHNIFGQEGSLKQPDTRNIKGLNFSKENIFNNTLNAANDVFLMDSSVCHDWDTPTNSWVRNQKHIYEYDANGKMIRDLFQRWNDSIYTWASSILSTYTNNANGYPTSYISKYWDGISWIISHHDTFVYNNNGKLISILFQSQKVGIWNVQKDTFIYDVNENLISMSSQGWNGTSWINGVQNTYTYDANRNLINYIIQKWNDTISTWKNNTKVIYTYDTNSNRTSELIQSWSDTIWANNNKHSWTYDTNGELTNELFQTWWCGDTLGNNYQTIWSYDNNGNQIHWLHQSWINLAWENRSQATFTYDANGNKTSMVVSEEWVGTSSLKEDSCHYYYHKFTGIADEETNKKRIKVSIYPNPFSNSTAIEIKNAEQRKENYELKVYDVFGQKVHQQTINSSQEILNMNLPGGIYIYKLYSEKKEIIGNGKLIIQ